MGIRRLGKSRSVQRLLWVAVILSPLLAGVVLGWLSGSGIGGLDAWNTGRNDEMGYYSAVVTMREIGLPAGVNSYNEVRSAYPAYGAYNYVTYFPLYLASLATGWAGRNMVVYANVLLMILAWGCVVLILRPGAKESVCLILLAVLNLPLTEYTWSGMNETVCCLLSMASMALALRLVRDPGEGRETNPRVFRAAYAALVLAVFVGGLIRPFMLAFMLLPLICLIGPDRSKVNKLILFLSGIGAALLALFLFSWMSGRFCAAYFQDRPTLQTYAELTGREGFGELLRSIGNANARTVSWLLQALKAWQPVGIVTAECIVLFLMAGYDFLRFWKKDRRRAGLSAAFAVIFPVFFEANVLFNVSNWLDRMFLPLLCSGALFLTFIHPEGRRIGAKAQILLLCLAAAVSLLNGTVKAFALPQRSGGEKNDAALTAALAEAIPRSEGDAWENTVATAFRGVSDVRFCMPPYVGISLCHENYLVSAIREDRIKSRYILVEDTEDALKAQCGEAGYPAVWADRGFTLHRVVLPPPQILVTVDGDREITLRLAGDCREFEAETEFRWRIYCGGEHLEEYDRVLDPRAAYSFILARDGEYRAELIPSPGYGEAERCVLRAEFPVSHEVDILRAGENTVLLDYIGPAREAEGSGFAWSVYRNGERVPELGRSYQPNPAYLVTLPEDGAYTFKCFRSVNEEKGSAVSFSVTVINGSLAEDPRLGEINPEEAAKRTKPELEILVTVTGERTVRLSVIDNTLPTGPEHTYAWYVYRDGRRLKEYDRGYGPDPEYELVLAEAGEYTFKLFCRMGNTGKSAVSEPVSVGAAGSGGD